MDVGYHSFRRACFGSHKTPFPLELQSFCVLAGSNTQMKPANLAAQPRSKASPHPMIHNLGIALLMCSFFNIQHSGTASNPSPQVQQPTIPMLDEGKGLIHLDVSVTKPDGEPVSSLTRENFELLDEGDRKSVV